ncbi:hypothetical protein [Enterococcus xiangfangensis]|uniref:ABC transporter permease n=1 Tax=Enterococcus xiangfangensis TaxID=1296537 RepID=A0ABU3F9I7_9ENTE|nr:hypothetical protein [Enterococcus xiangfangensis]MDT2759145.1 hypothetical protein [Enterococcus xiangfangensis]
MDKRRLKNLILYHLYSSKILVGILLLILSINLVLGIVLKGVPGPVGSIDAAAFIFGMFVGFELFKEAFSFAIINGISRKTYYLSNIISTLMMSVFLGSVTAIVSLISFEFADNIVLYSLLYSDDIIGLFLWNFAVFFAMISLFHFTSLLLYRVSKKIKYLIILGLALLAPLIVVLGIWFSGFQAVVQKFMLLFAGIYQTNEGVRISPYVSSAMLLFLSAVIVAVSWLLLRRIEAK